MWSLIAEILLLICAAFVFGTLAQRLKQSPILGYLLAGTIIGPLLFNRQVVLDVAELGVSLLLFSIGLEFSFRRLKSLGLIALVGGSFQVFITLGVCSLLFSIFVSPATAAVLGAMVALSSTAVVLRVLVDRAEIDSTRGRTALGILLFQDIAVVPLVLMVSLLSRGATGEPFFVPLLKTLGSAAGILFVFYLLFYRIFPWVMSSGKIFTNRELFVLLTIAAAIGSIWSAHSLGLSPALGAFLAGMLLGESPFATQIRSDIGSIRTLFVTLFFTSVGMLADPVWFLANWPIVLFWLATVLVIKSFIIMIICLFFRMGPRLALASGMTLAQVGEFSLVLAGAAREGNLINGDIFALIVAVTILSLFVAPYMVIYAFPVSDWILNIVLRGKKIQPSDGIPSGSAVFDRIGIIGFGPAGQRVADALLKQGHSPFVIELNPKSAEVAQRKSLTVHMGDASQSEVLAHAGISSTAVLIVTLPDPRTARIVIEHIRQMAPQVTIIARGRYNISLEDLQEAGADVVVDEESVVGDMLAQKLCDLTLQQQGITMACGLAGERDPSQSVGNEIV
jgi:CPA2 family monovalent cation:H+ antiporter-2